MDIVSAWLRDFREAELKPDTVLGINIHRMCNQTSCFSSHVALWMCLDSESLTANLQTCWDILYFSGLRIPLFIRLSFRGRLVHGCQGIGTPSQLYPEGFKPRRHLPSPFSAGIGMTLGCHRSVPSLGLSAIRVLLNTGPPF